VLHKVELFVARLGPEILAHHHGVVFLRVAFLIYEKDTLAFSERRIGEDHRVIPAPRRGEAVVPGVDHHLVAADAVQVASTTHREKGFAQRAMPRVR